MVVLEWGHPIMEKDNSGMEVEWGVRRRQGWQGGGGSGGGGRGGEGVAGGILCGSFISLFIMVR